MARIPAQTKGTIKRMLDERERRLGTSFDNERGRSSGWLKKEAPSPVKTLSRSEIEAMGLEVSDRPLERNPAPITNRMEKQRASTRSNKKRRRKGRKESSAKNKKRNFYREAKKLEKKTGWAHREMAAEADKYI